jgi:exopolysaccharide biosynthesis polyprenyl glycosylphosphotransferase
LIPRRFWWLLDLALFAFAFLLAYTTWAYLRDLLQASVVPLALRPAPSGTLPSLRAVARVVFTSGVVAVTALELFGAYRPILRQSRTRIFYYAIAAPLVSTAAITMFLFFDKREGWSRLFLVTFVVYSTIGLLLFRLLLRHYFASRRKAGFYAKSVLIVGPAEALRWLEKYIAESVPNNEYQIVGCLSIPGDDDAATLSTPCLGRADRLGETLISTRVDEVIAVQPDVDASWIPSIIENCDALGILLRIVPQSLLFGKVRTLRTLYPFQMLHLPAVVLAPPHFDSDALFFKRLFDVVASATLLILLSPLFLFIAILIKLADRRGPIFYRWNVVGRNGARFTGYKFTTMYEDADERRRELLDKNEMTGPVFKIKNDPRVTPIGRFLRKYSLNELPQLWSVLKGDMSLVGPRPAFPHELDGYGFWHKRKLSIRPGITCLWQVRGRNKISSFDDWVKMDLEYIDNWSLWLDFKILLWTAWAVVAGTGS